ncbi:pyridoxal phosphate-dependent transferase [Elsinoe ampelina]|uniref:Pyridoxal phosphate-dependent transferase n=1 Tax=Elsinoe ampelina TaxID=302913 RepID=A0A6A6GHE8_9PEZI|nr:pyridoxal phosphate-dependent transferase [Elsinoe ampelina]
MVLRHSNEPDQAIECGVDARKHFPFDDDYLNLNHGSFGAIPKTVRDVQRTYQDASQARPDIHIRYEYPPLLSKSRTAIASYLQCPKSSVVYTPNATTGLNTILRNLVFSPNDVAIYFSTIYSAIEKTLLYLTETTPLTLHRIELTHPLSDDHVLALFHTAIATIRSQGKNPRLAVFDTISSVPGILCPFPQLVTTCRAENILSVIDGAHCVGHIPINLTSLDPDFFVSNLHKWLYVPRPCAIMYVPERNQHLMRSSLPTSHGFVPAAAEGINDPLPKAAGETLNAYEANFTFTGTLDNSPYLCIPAALEWRFRLTWRGKQGEDAVFGYNHHLAQRAGEIVSLALGTEVMENAEGTLGGCAFSNVRLPLHYADLLSGEVQFGKVLEIARWMEKVLVDEFRTFVAIFWHRGRFWVRLSGQVYLTEDDWERAGRWLVEVCGRAKGRDWEGEV